MPEMKEKMVQPRIDPREVLLSLRLLSPREIFRLLEEMGYRGQEAARRSASLFAYRHVRRLQRLYCERIPRSALPPKTNMLMIGPTGCGKTFLMELLFGEIFPLPQVVVDVSRFTETGYVGQDVTAVLTRLLMAAGGDPGFARLGVVVLDEIDKLALQTSASRFAGAETTKDVKGNVQKELLQIVAGSDISVPRVETESHLAPRLIMDTRDIGFVATGAFSGIKELAIRQNGGRLGFRVAPAVDDDTVAYNLTETDVLSVDLLQSYGFLPEFIGRFGQICRLGPLSRQDLRQILVDNILPPLQREFELEGVQLTVSPAEMSHFLDEAIQRQTGARGLRTAIEQHVESLAFERFGRHGHVVAATQPRLASAG